MRYIFDHLNLIRETLLRSPVGLITDVDGTISRIAPTPQQARISSSCRYYLIRLSHQLAVVAAISGRPVAQLKGMVGIDGMVYIGNHGLERGEKTRTKLATDTSDYFRVINSVVKKLAPLLAIEGINIENKGMTATIHYRLCNDPQLAEREILKLVAALPQAKRLTIIKDRMAIDLISPTDINKGTATRDLIREYNLRGGIYLGDDTTDIAAFQAIRTANSPPDFQGWAIAVNSPEVPPELISAADFLLEGVSDVERFLKWLTENTVQSS
ncbi:MAG: trehalose-phosphatase [Dehalococcoidales bacterium]|nr:trehalose-phosphatase [Dehalococcoidales bacterium]